MTFLSAALNSEKKRKRFFAATRPKHIQPLGYVFGPTNPSGKLALQLTLPFNKKSDQILASTLQWL